MEAMVGGENKKSIHGKVKTPDSLFSFHSCLYDEWHL